MSLKDDLVYISQDDGDDIEIIVPGSKIIFKSPERAPIQPGGKVDFVASGSFEKIPSRLKEENELGKFARILSCSWPCYNQIAQVALSIDIIAAFYLVQKSELFDGDVTESDDLIQYLIQQIEMQERYIAKEFEKDFDAYCKDHYFAKAPEDFSDISCAGRNWKHSLSGSISMDMETADFVTAISPECLLFVSVGAYVQQDSIKNAPDLNEFKHFQVTEFLKHIRIEPID